MLDTLDVLIGFTLVMLIMSMAVTMLTQFIGTFLLNLRGRALKSGVARLIALLDRGLTPDQADKIADHILRNPLVGTAGVVSSKMSLGTAIHREELVKLILDFAVEGDAEKARGSEPTDTTNRSEAEKAQQGDPTDTMVRGDEEKTQKNEPPQTKEEELAELRKTIHNSLVANGIPDPAAVLESIRNALIELERSNPEMSQGARASVAILTHAASDFLSKVNGWFDQTIDRVSDLFTAQIRTVTAIIAVLLAFVLHLDAIGLINRLAVDDELRMQLVAAAIERAEGPAPTAPEPAADVGEQVELTVPAGPTPAELPGGEETPDTADAAAEPAPDFEETLQAIRDAGAAELEEYGLISIPRSGGEWLNRWTEGLDEEDAVFPAVLMRLLGILLSAALMSLGAPFWYSALRDLVKLRSVVARRDDAERDERQKSQQVAAPAPSQALPAPYRGGEAGDLEPAG